MVPRVVFGKGSFNQLISILDLKRKKQAPFIFIVDDVFDQPGSIADRIELKYNDKLNKKSYKSIIENKDITEEDLKELQERVRQQKMNELFEEPSTYEDEDE